MPITMIVKVASLAKEIEEEMPTPCRSRWSQPLSDSEHSNEESSNDEQKKKKGKS
jgi:hypothetical protein